MKLQFELEPRPLRSTSPTRAESLRACLLRAGFDSDPNCRSLVFRGPAARLGTVCHRILELAARGFFDRLASEQLQSTFDQLWDQLVEEQAAQAAGSPVEQHLGVPSRWPHYQLKRALLLVRVKQVAASRSGMVSGYQAKVADSGETVEATYRGFGGRLTGRIDRITRSREHVEIEDHKTGALAGSAAAGHDAVRESYRRQLLLYAALHWENSGVWPCRAHVIGLDGARVTIEIDPATTLALVNETLDLLARYNQLVGLGHPLTSYATPSAAACEHCSYMALCTPFWRLVSPDWDLYKVVVVAGSIANVVDSQAGGRILEIDVTAGNRPPGRYRLRGLTPARFPDLDDIQVGYHVRLVAALPANQEAGFELRPSLYTQLWWCAP